MPVQMRVRLHRACIVHMRTGADQFGALGRQHRAREEPAMFLARAGGAGPNLRRS
ncbi:MAG TPA: hypothetical protein VMR62_03450 [Bryobacteraceae bacterium]|jgi:hypothetical protein|nr:hypothetical protein [Bryobacteraceae bacterium]